MCERGALKLPALLCVSKEALALLQTDSKGHRRYTFAELMMRARVHEFVVQSVSLKQALADLHLVSRLRCQRLPSADLCAGQGLLHRPACAVATRQPGQPRQDHLPGGERAVVV